MVNFGEWIDVDEQLPEEDGEYLCYCRDECIYLYIYKGDGWYEDFEDDINPIYENDFNSKCVRYWMPLPDAPRPLTKEEQFKQNMQYVCDYYSDIEIRHCEMDRLMAQTLRDLGYGEGVDIFDNTSKWYA